MLVNRLAKALEVLERRSPTTKELEPFCESNRDKYITQFAMAFDLAKAPLTEAEFDSMLADLDE